LKTDHPNTSDQLDLLTPPTNKKSLKINPINGIRMKKSTIISALIISLLILTTSYASIAPEEEWNRTYGGESFDYAYSVLQTSDGYIIAGVTTSYGSGKEDAWVIKTDSEGNEIWNRTYGGILEDAAYSIIQTSDGGYIIAGHTRSESHGIFPDAWLIKLSREKELTDKIPQNNNTSPSESDTESPGFEVFAFFFSMILTLILLRRKK